MEHLSMGTRYFSVITSNINSPQHHSRIKLNFRFDVQKCEIRECRERDSLPRRAVKPKSVSFFATCFIYISISRQRYRAVLLGSHVDRRSIRFGTRAHPQTRTYAHIYTYIATRARAFTRPRRIAADTHAFCNETVQITAARTAMHVIMNAGRLFVSVPSAGNIGHFEFSIFNALVSPFGPLLLSHRPFPPLALPPARVLPPVGCCCRRTPPPPPPLGRVHVALVYERAPSALVHYMVGHIVVFGEISSHFGRYLCTRGSGRGVSFH